MKDKIFELSQEFSAETHGSSHYDKEPIFVMGKNTNEYVPFSYIQKKIPEIKTIRDLLMNGFVYSSFDFLDTDHFKNWYLNQFSKKLLVKSYKSIDIFHFPDQKTIFDAVEVVNKQFDVLHKTFVLMNNKNLPVQLGEWYIKLIFGLKQVKTSSQRGFDFFDENEKKIEVKVQWGDKSSPKGVRIKKSLIELSDRTIVVYVAKSFMIRDILYLDSDFVLRKFSSKGHAVYLKDTDVSGYFFSKSDKHFDKVINKNSLMRFASPGFAMKLSGKF
ncbi:MAG: hypothetical protein JNM93_12500 [Bacteriovoracaceae bacterium]|nr:hypothetical protein [Bacteriovoracaceae bacterium]